MVSFTRCKSSGSDLYNISDNSRIITSLKRFQSDGIWTFPLQLLQLCSVFGACRGTLLTESALQNEALSLLQAMAAETYKNA
jgi:hypothetical protein